MTTMPKFSIPPDDGPDRLLSLHNSRGMRVTISPWGAALVGWQAPDRYGRTGDILLGYPEPGHYASNAGYFGAVLGRWANRIAGARFTLDGSPYEVEPNEGAHHLHGASSGFHLAKWDAVTEDGQVRLRLFSADGHGGFPGNLEAEVCYRLDNAGRLSIEFTAVADAPTPVNLTSHPYFNLNGGASGIGDHMLMIHADSFLKVDAALIPTELAPVAGTPFDFRAAAPIGPRLAWPDAQLALTGGFDHCFRLAPPAPYGAPLLREVARVYEPGSGRELSVSTTAPGLQFYSGNSLGGIGGRGAAPYAAYDGFCLEAQAFPDQINSPTAEAVILRPGQVYRQTTVYRVDLRQ